ncbi:MAG: hypothetical protein GC160_22475 [Acidobacteria bacterium]|nr:hypothetical protein [Acidobacteriota bacterium]
MSYIKFFAFTVLAFGVSFGCGGGAPAPESSGGSETAETAAPPAETFNVDPATAATVSGKIFFDGEAPQPQRINIADEECKAMHSDPIFSEQTVVNDDGTLQNVLVWVKKGLEGKTFPVSGDKVKLDQIGCIYKPHVAAVQVGQTLSVTNSDPTLHNVHPLPRVNPEWNKSQAAGAGAIEEKFPKQELMIPVKCNIHPWMRSYISVIEHPFFAVTGADGSFEITGLPPGEYTIEAVHERLGNQETTVKVGDGESAAVELRFSN